MFDKLINNPQLLDALAQEQILIPTDVQKTVIPQIVQGGDFVVQAYTGSGKTLCFVLPLLNNLLNNADSRALIIAPTRELAGQLSDDIDALANRLNIVSTLITSGENYKKQAGKIEDARIIIATPGRLLEHLEASDAFLSNIDHLICDESDQVLSMGLGNQVLEIASKCAVKRSHWLFSATAKPLSHGFVKTLLNDQPVTRMMIRELPDCIDHTRLLADNPKHKQRLLSALLSQQDDMRIVIFVNTQKECQELAHYLRYQKYEVSYLHGGLDSKQRKSALSYFVEEKSNILVATDVAARGLNMGDIEWVINFDTPAEKADYVHRVGRTGRGDGVKGLAINFVTSHDWDDYAGFANSLGITMPIFHIDGFEGDYKGPKKLKQSGKAAKTTKRKKPDAKAKAKAKAKK